ncbi:MAG: hypothetical protein I3273_03430 [Candidatus Moeniiplasma glomeromycotorum]|nr:hypothetical protein [Candidatus Moeniiplasma glomeromycotorum]MCE8167753.1 hypothetical protein [Candidatus Moeniiplasma glomeromycotorum]MCE8169153.1 hypothetical protein [Candidatus Moeniiplasma glomeromycotorum]
MKNYQCQECKKHFNTQQVYLWGKDKHSFCQSCNERNKKKCSWCEKDLNCPSDKFKVCYLHNHHETHRWNNDDSGEYECEVFCDNNCKKKFDQYQENTPEKITERKKVQELLNKGYKFCGRNLIPFEQLKIDCRNLIPPTEKICETCQKRQHEQEKKQKTEKDLAERKKEYEKKYQQAQEWWNSLSKVEKQKQIKELEENWKKEAWFSRYFHNDKNSLEFKNGKIYYDNWSEVPPPLLEKFGIGYDFSEYTSGGKSFVSSNNLQVKINNLISKLQEVKKSGSKTEIDNLEKEIHSLKDQQQKENSTSENSPTLSSNHSYWPWIIGIGSVFLVGIVGIWVVVKKWKKSKIII